MSKKIEKSEKMCNCDETCECGCNEGKECTCGCECNSDSSCTCGDECHCEEECTCGEECQCKVEEESDIINQLQAEIKEKDNEILKCKADLINYRKRKDEEVARMLKYSNEDIVKELLPILDNFERAIKLDDNNLTDELSKFLEGFKMIYCNMNSIMEKFDVKAIDGSNKPFDPTYHQAVLTEKVDGTEPGMVIEVMQKGYLLKDRVIRHAMVKVSE